MLQHGIVLLLTAGAARGRKRVARRRLYLDVVSQPASLPRRENKKRLVSRKQTIIRRSQSFAPRFLASPRVRRFLGFLPRFPS